MAKFLDTLQDLLNFIDDMVKNICIFLTGLMALTVVSQVLFRYILKNPLVWTEELARYLMIWTAFIGASSMIKSWENVYVDYFVNKLPAKAGKAVDLIIKLAMLGFSVWIFLMSINVFPNVSMNQVTPALGIKMIWPQFGIIIGMLLVILQLAGIILKGIFKVEQAVMKNDVSNGGII